MVAKIKIKENGSIEISGDFELFDAAEGKFDLNGRSKISLCRCGKTENSPFCDGAHGKCGFVSSVTARQLPPMKQQTITSLSTGITQSAENQTILKIKQ